MKEKLTKKEDFQAYINCLIEEQDFAYCTADSKEIECHINVDLVLSKSLTELKSKSNKNYKSEKLSSGNSRGIDKKNTSYSSKILSNSSHQDSLVYPRREKLIYNINEPVRKESSIGSRLYSMFI